LNQPSQRLATPYFFNGIGHEYAFGRTRLETLLVDCGGHGAHGAEHHSFTGVTMGAPLPFSNTTTNLAGSVLLALRPTT